MKIYLNSVKEIGFDRVKKNGLLLTKILQVIIYNSEIIWIIAPWTWKN